MMSESIAGWLQWLQNSSWAVGVRQSLWLYPALEIIHITGIVLVAGGAIFFDLRLLGMSKKIPVTDMARHLLTWSKRGLILAIPSGILLFITNAETLGYDPTFHTKLILLALAGINAWIFHAFVFRPEVQFNSGSSWYRAGKANAVCSILLWIAVIACGRLLAY